MKVALLFDHFGPYHKARLSASTHLMNVIGVEFHSRSRDYLWRPDGAQGLPIETVLHSIKKNLLKIRSELHSTLSRIKPDVVAIPGWTSPGALAALSWCLYNQVPSVLMSESCSHDSNRGLIKEYIKRLIVSCYDSAFVGGSLHREYLLNLGFSSSVSQGYDAVDNQYFSKRTAELKNTTSTPQTKYFLASARFIPQKNLFRLIEAYALYISRNHSKVPWRLILLGDGELRDDLQSHIAKLAISHLVTLPGFLQYEDLPKCYANASAFVHASTIEPWGLVVNEALASGLPVLVSDRCGCSADLVINGVNGYHFDPFKIDSIASSMLTISNASENELHKMADEGRKIINNWGPERFASGLSEAANYAIQAKTRSSSTMGRMLVHILSRR